MSTPRTLKDDPRDLFGRLALEVARRIRFVFWFLSSDDADDLTQDTLLALWRHWLRRLQLEVMVADEEAIKLGVSIAFCQRDNWLRRRERRYLDNCLPLDEQQCECRARADLRAEVVDLLETARREMSADEYRILLAVAEDGLSFTDVAEQYGHPRRDVGRRFRSAVEKLRRLGGEEAGNSAGNRPGAISSAAVAREPHLTAATARS